MAFQAFRTRSGESNLLVTATITIKYLWKFQRWNVYAYVRETSAGNFATTERCMKNICWTPWNTGRRLCDTPKYIFIFHRLRACLSRFTRGNERDTYESFRTTRRISRKFSIPERMGVTKFSWNKRFARFRENKSFEVIWHFWNVWTEMYYARTFVQILKGEVLRGRYAGWKEKKAYPWILS